MTEPWLAALLAILIAACGPPKIDPNAPTTAREKQLQQARKSGELTNQSSHGWGAGWGYSGNRNHCYYVLGRRCFKTRKAACAHARCRHHMRCEAVGGGPATIRCVKR